jgi:hypothetical protein
VNAAAAAGDSGLALGEQKAPLREATGASILTR